MSVAVVVLGDVIRSRNVEDRPAFRTALETACSLVNTADVELEAPFTVLKGVDEIGGVLSSPDSIYDVVKTFDEALFPQEIRLVAAAGAVDVGFDRSRVAEMDGPAFHTASHLLNEITNDGLSFGLRLGFDPLDSVVTDEINLVLQRRRNWSRRQREIVATYEEVGSQSGVADRLQISQQAVSSALQRADWPLIRRAESNLNDAFRTIELT